MKSVRLPKLSIKGALDMKKFINQEATSTDLLSQAQHLLMRNSWLEQS